MFNTVLVPLNLSESVDEIYSLVSFMNHFDTDTVTFLTVSISSQRAVRHAYRKMEKYTEYCADTGMTFNTSVVHGSAASGIVKASLDTDFIAFPWERKSIVQHALLGSITKDVVRLTEKPVFIYKQWFLNNSNDLNTILFASDLNPLEQWIMPYLTSPGLAAENLVILHVGDRAPDPAAEKQRLEIVDTKMDYVRKECTTEFSEITKRTLSGKPHTVITRQARKTNADLVIISKHSDGTARQKVLGSTAENIVHRARCSVLVIPDQKTGALNYETD